MMMLINWPTQAIQKLTEEKKTVSGNRERVMCGPVFEALKDFCLQDVEFAQAVAQGGSFAECMRKIASGVGNAISDLDVYKKAVQFYFPGAQVRMQLTIDLIGDAAQPEQPEQKSESIVLNLMDIL